MRMRDRTTAYQVTDVDVSGGNALFDTAIFDSSYFVAENPVLKNIPLRRQISGKMMYCLFEQTADDTQFDLVSCSVSGTMKKTRFT